MAPPSDVSPIPGGWQHSPMGHPADAHDYGPPNAPAVTQAEHQFPSLVTPGYVAQLSHVIPMPAAIPQDAGSSSLSAPRMDGMVGRSVRSSDC